jgi:nitrogen-specific signal transduction histidine kinase
MIMGSPRRPSGAPSSRTKRRSLDDAQPDAAVILAALADPLIVIDRSGNIRFVNPAAEQFLGSSAAALCGSALADLVARHSPLLSIRSTCGRG